MKRSEHNKLLKAELEWIPSDYDLLTEFWIDGYTHIIISKKPNGNFQILRSWFMKEPAISIDAKDTDLQGVIGYLLSHIEPKAPFIKKD